MGARNSAGHRDGRKISFSAFLSRHLLSWLAVCLVALLLAGLLGYKSGDSRSLRRYKAQLRAQGERLTLTELQPTAKVDYTAAAVLTGEGQHLSSHSLCPGNLDLMVCVAPGRAKVAWKQDTPPWINAKPGQPVVGWDELETEMAATGDSLAALREVLKNPPPTCFPPWTNVLQQTLPNMVHLRLAAQWLCGDAIGKLHRGKLEEALQDLEALAACAQVNREDSTLVAQMIRVAIAGLGLSATWEALQAPGWTEPQLERLQTAWEPVDLVDALERGFVGMRAHGGEIWALARRGASGRQFRTALTMNPTTNLTFQTFVSDYMLFPLYKLHGIDEDELLRLESFQGTISAIRLIKHGQPWTEDKDGLAKGCAELNKLSRSPARFRHLLGFMLKPNCVRAVKVGTQNETLRQLTLTAIALKRFQMRHGTLPLNLRALSPEILPVATYDPLGGQTLQYLVRHDGGYVLYSVGQDGHDDGGETPFWFHGTYGLWEEPDAVWPTATEAFLALSTLRQ